ncbi:hypothetical protein scyTo_0020725 [Scyliorhinus torazame]|uniref:LIM zinc-binding domain-containing protein n=1 Tax=Scyliorhinus torazame TaxID=75743 RepID=A0A401Q0G7_SCYTO|nr:hypothetical protein [Scyliorhinus torazame]
MADALASATCGRCRTHFDPSERIVNSNGELYHEKCFVCAQCFQEFPGGVFYEFEGRKYCEHDFQMLFAPCCGQCGEFIIGRVIKAMNNNWHPDCFCCEICSVALADVGFVKNAGRETNNEMQCVIQRVSVMLECLIERVTVRLKCVIEKITMKYSVLYREQQ